MILPDANLLIYAYNIRTPEHGRAKAWLEECLSSSLPFLLSWQVITAFLRITTNRIFPHPLTITAADEIVSNWLAGPNTAIVLPTSRHWPILSRLLETSQATGPLVMDAHLAALAIEHGATLASADHDFKRFDGLKLINPLLD